MTLKLQDRHYTIEEYLAYSEQALEKHEYYKGKIVKMSGATPIHNILAANIIYTLKTAIKQLKKTNANPEKKYSVLTADTPIRVESLDSFVYPDALVICEKPKMYKNSTMVITNPLLVVEVLSPSTAEYDRKQKFDYYRTIPSFQEYVLVAQDRKRISVYYRTSGDNWNINDATEANIELRSIGCRIEVEDVYDGVDFERPETKDKT